MTVTVQLTYAGSDTNYFSLYSDYNAFASPYVTGIPRASLLAGYTTSFIPDGSTIVRVKSNGTCVNATDFIIQNNTTTTTTTAPPYYALYLSYNTTTSQFTLAATIAPTQLVKITNVLTTEMHGLNSCNRGDLQGTATINANSLVLNPATISTTQYENSHTGSWMSGSFYKFNTLPVQIQVGTGTPTYYNNGDTVPIGGHYYNLVISKTCL